MKALVQLGIAVVAGFSVLPAGAAEEARVSIDARGEPLRAALKKLAAGTPTVITVDPKIPDVPVRMALREVTLDHALRLITRQASKEVPQLTYEATEHGFRLFLAAPENGSAPAEDPNKVTITVRKQPKPEPTEGQDSDPEPVEAASGEGERVNGPEMNLPGSGEFVAPPGLGGGPYLIQPVAPIFLRWALEPRATEYRIGYLLWGIPGKPAERQRIPPPKIRVPQLFHTSVGRYGDPWRRRPSPPAPRGGPSGGSGRGGGGIGLPPL